MGQRPKVGVYHGDREWCEKAKITCFPSDHFQSSIWQSSDSTYPGLSLQLTDKITERVILPPLHDESLVFATAVSVDDAYSQDEPVQTQKQVIVKVFQRIPNIPPPEDKEYVSVRHLFSQELATVEEAADEPPLHYETELETLQHLTRHGSNRTPSFIASFEKNESNTRVKDGFLGFVVMEKFSAVTVSDFWEFTPTSEAQLNEQLLIQESFKTTYVDLCNLGVTSMDPGGRNLMWDSKSRTRYCIDFEMAVTYEVPSTPKTWELLTAEIGDAFVHLDGWDIILDYQCKEFGNGF